MRTATPENPYRPPQSQLAASPFVEWVLWGCEAYVAMHVLVVAACLWTGWSNQGRLPLVRGNLDWELANASGMLILAGIFVSGWMIANGRQSQRTSLLALGLGEGTLSVVHVACLWPLMR